MGNNTATKIKIPELQHLDVVIRSLKDAAEVTRRKDLWDLKQAIASMIFKIGETDKKQSINSRELKYKVQSAAASVRTRHHDHQNRPWYKTFSGWITGSGAADHASIMNEQSKLELDSSLLVERMSFQLEQAYGDINKLQLLSVFQVVCDNELESSDGFFSRSFRFIKMAGRKVLSMGGVTLKPNAIQLLESTNFFEVSQKKEEVSLRPEEVIDKPKLIFQYLAPGPHVYDGGSVCKACGGSKAANESWQPSCNKRVAPKNVDIKERGIPLGPHVYNSDGVCKVCGGSKDANYSWQPSCYKSVA